MTAMLLAASAAAWAQTTAVTPIARPADVASPDAIIAAAMGRAGGS